MAKPINRNKADRIAAENWLIATAPGVLHRPFVAVLDGVIVARSSDRAALVKWSSDLDGCEIKFAK